MMSQTTTINVRIDTDVKREVEELLNEMGMNISTAVNVFFKQIQFDKALPFKPTTKRTKLTLKELLKDYKGEYRGEEWDTGEPVGKEIF